MPQTARVNSSLSSPFLASFLQAVLLQGHLPQDAFVLLRVRHVSAFSFEFLLLLRTDRFKFSHYRP